MQKPDRQGGCLMLQKPDRQGGCLMLQKPDRQGGCVAMQKPDRQGGCLMLQKPDRQGGSSLRANTRPRPKRFLAPRAWSITLTSQTSPGSTYALVKSAALNEFPKPTNFY